MSDLPPGWAEATVGQCFDLVRGVTYKKEDAGSLPSEERIGLLRATNIQGGRLDRDDLVYIPRRYVSGEQRLRKDDVVFASSSGSASVVGKAGRVTGETSDTFGAFCTVAREREAGLGIWLTHITLTEEYRAYVESVALGTNINNFRNSDLSAYAIALPPLAEQRRIVAKIDALIARSQRARTELTRVRELAAKARQALLGGAVTGELTAGFRSSRQLEAATSLIARTPAPTQGRGGREATDQVIPGRYALSVNDPGRSAPSGWSWTHLLRVSRQETGHTPSRLHPEYWDGDVSWIGIRDVGAHHGRDISETTQTVTQAGLDNSSARLLPKGTVCLSRTASVGYVVRMAREMATSQDFVTWTCSPALNSSFLLYALLAEGDDIRAFGKGSTHTTIYFPEVRALHICLPPIEEQREIVRIIREQLARIDAVVAEAERAAALLDRLDQAVLAKAFRGELVPQDPADEPASTLLARLAAAPAAPKRRGRKAAA